MDFEKIIPVELMQALVAECGGVQTQAINVTRPRWADMIMNYPDTSVDVITLYNGIGNGLYEMLLKNKAWEHMCF
jgi:hypothetical protein